MIDQLPLSNRDEEILAFLRAEQAAFYRGDLEAYCAHWHHGPEVRKTMSGPYTGTRIQIGWESLRPKLEESFRQAPQDFDAERLLRWDNIQIQSTPDMAWVYHDQILVGPAPGIRATPMSHCTKIVQRFDGAWKMVCLVVIAPGLGREDTPRIELDAAGDVIRVNRLAEARLPGHAGLTISGRRPRALNRAHDPGLQAAIAEQRARLAATMARMEGEELPEAVPLGDDPSGAPMFCWVSREQECVLISFDDDMLLQGRLELSASTFGLSPAQVRLAGQLAAGQDLGGAAACLGVSVNTARTQLRRMFQKTATHNQAGLVSRLLNLQPPG